jgi:hypothetical protein
MYRFSRASHSINCGTSAVTARAPEQSQYLCVTQLMPGHQMTGDQLDAGPLMLEHQSGERQDRVEVEPWIEIDPR